MVPLHYHWEWFVGAPASQVWPLISDTDRLNRVIGLPPVAWREEMLPEGGARRMGSFRVKGLFFEWEEHPFQWREFQAFSVLREYTRGPILRQEIAVRLERVGALNMRPGETENGTRLIWEVALEARHPLLVPLVRLIAADLVRALDALHRRMDLQLRGAPVAVFPPETVVLEPEAPARMDAIGRELRKKGFEAAWVDRLLEFVRTASSLDCMRMRAFALADAWEFPRVPVLKLFLHATRLGLLDLSWDLICPHCRGPKESNGNLGAMKEQAYCSSCEIDFEADFSKSVELTFHPNPAIRRVEAQSYCIGGPQNTPHVVAQSLLAPGAADRWELSLAPGAYRLRSPDGRATGMVEVVRPSGAQGRGGTATIAFGPDGFPAEPVVVVGPDVRLEVKNTRSGKHLVLLERTAWADHVVTADFVGTLQEFRSMFSEQVLAPGVKVKVASLAFLFSDLKSSTAMYEEQGDAKAFALVRDHFEVMEQPIAREGGAVVKTIGDAIMAVFPDPASCFRAGVAIQRAIAEYNRQSGDVPLVVKLGAHVGPCLAVNLSDRLDYFGTTVNVAARVQGESLGGDFVLTEAMTGDPGVARLLSELPCEVERYQMTLKGLSGTFNLTRLWPLRAQASAPALPQ